MTITAPNPEPAITIEPIAVSKAIAGELVGLSERTIDNLIADGALPVVRYGRAVRVRVDDLRTWAAQRAAESAARNGQNHPNDPENPVCSGPPATNPRI